MAQTTLYIPKMDCPTEQKMIQSKFYSVKGIQELKFDLIQQELTVVYDDITLSVIQEELKNIGMESQVRDASYTSEHLGALQEKVLYWDWFILAVAGVLAFASEIVAYITRVEDSPIIIILALASMLVGGRQVFVKGIQSVRYFTLNINFLMTIAIIGAVIINEWPEAAMVTFLFALAEMIEGYSLDKARHAIRQLMEVAPEVAIVKVDGDWQERPVDQVQLNDIVRVKPGERIPIDGVIVNGKSSVNQAPITGESFPVSKEVGDTVFAGSINERGSFEFKVTVRVNETLIAKIIRAVHQAQSDRAPVQRFVDQFAKYYTPCMVILAILIATIPTVLFDEPFSLWLYKALVLLVIACPCALVISTPVTIVSGLAAAAKHGLLIKGGTYLEMGHRLKAIAFDKTGTLTHGKSQVTDVVVMSEMDEKLAVHLAASLESHSEHPIAEAILMKWKSSSCVGTLLEVNDFHAVPGRGIVGDINGHSYFLGNHRFAEEKNVCNAGAESKLKDLEIQGKTTVVLGNDSKILAILAVTDTLRTSSVDAIQSLHDLGIKTIMITGDNPTTAQKIAESLSIDDVQANLLPQDKLSVMEALKAKYGVVGMVGDGINDAPALAKASIGFAMGHGGTDVALETADIALMENNLSKLPLFVALSKRTWVKLVENISLSIGIKAIFFGLALFGIATLWMAVFADMGASLIVVLNGLGLLRFSK